VIFCPGNFYKIPAMGAIRATVQVMMILMYTSIVSLSTRLFYVSAV